MQRTAPCWTWLCIFLLVIGYTEIGQSWPIPDLRKGDLGRVDKRSRSPEQEQISNQTHRRHGDLRISERAGRLTARSMKLDIVIAHYDYQRISSMSEFWLWFFDLDLVRKWEPYVFIYCQGHDEAMMKELQPFLKHGGELIHLENAGRESHAYLQHITRYYANLANHTLFSQDEPNTNLLPKLFEKLFEERTGYLPLSFMGHVDCFEMLHGRIPPKAIPQLYGMLTKSFCPPDGYASGFEGQFLVSKQRILSQDLGIYRYLMTMLSASRGHWIHDYHDFEAFKEKTNPHLGHALERAWSLAFDCHAIWRQQNCYHCIWEQQMENCGGDACQCYDN